MLYTYIQSVPGGKVNILESHIIGHSKQKKYVYMCPILNGFRDRAILLYSTLYTLHCADEQLAMSSSHELQCALMLTVEFSKMYCDLQTGC
jgi:hypothetical protein